MWVFSTSLWKLLAGICLWYLYSGFLTYDFSFSNSLHSQCSSWMFSCFPHFNSLIPWSISFFCVRYLFYPFLCYFSFCIAFFTTVFWYSYCRKPFTIKIFAASHTFKCFLFGLHVIFLRSERLVVVCSSTCRCSIQILCLPLVVCKVPGGTDWLVRISRFPVARWSLVCISGGVMLVFSSALVRMGGTRSGRLTYTPHPDGVLWFSCWVLLLRSFCGGVVRGLWVWVLCAWYNLIVIWVPVNVYCVYLLAFLVSSV